MKNNTIQEYIRPDILRMAPYVPGTSAWDLAKKYNQDIKDLIKLNANENPYGPSPVAKMALQNSMLNYYPQSDYIALRKLIAEYAAVRTENILVGSGSDEVIDLVLRSVIQDGDKIINCPPTFDMYRAYALLNKATIINIPRNKNFGLNMQDILKYCPDKKVKMVFLCNPNSPTGNLISSADIVKILNTGKLVIVDEAYYEFSKATVVPLIAKFGNLVILRSFSKWAGLAGLRLGYAIMSPTLVKEIMKIKPPFNINVAAEIAAIATLQDMSFSQKTIQKIIEERDLMYIKLQKITRIKAYPPYGNFIFIETNKEDYQLLRDLLEKNKIALRYNQSSLLKNGIRITVGKKYQNEQLLKILEEFYE